MGNSGTLFKLSLKLALSWLDFYCTGDCSFFSELWFLAVIEVTVVCFFCESLLFLSSIETILSLSFSLCWDGLLAKPGFLNLGENLFSRGGTGFIYFKSGWTGGFKLFFELLAMGTNCFRLPRFALISGSFWGLSAIFLGWLSLDMLACCRFRLIIVLLP